MSLARLAGTSAVMAGVAVGLSVLAPAPAVLLSALADGQRTADVAGPDTLVLALAGLLAWLVWAWGSVGLLLTALSAAPGLVGAPARLLLPVLLPAAARRAAALALGVGLGVVAPVAGVPGPGIPTAAAAPSTPAAPSADAAPWAVVPDWPTAPSAGAAPWAVVPDWPAAPPASTAVPDWPVPTGHVVVRGDCLWDVAAAWLRDRHGIEPSAAAVAAAVAAWWRTNEAVIGPDPDLLLPGQVLVPPP